MRARSRRSRWRKQGSTRHGRECVCQRAGSALGADTSLSVWCVQAAWLSAGVGAVKKASCVQMGSPKHVKTCRKRHSMLIPLPACSEALKQGCAKLQSSRSPTWMALRGPLLSSFSTTSPLLPIDRPADPTASSKPALHPSTQQLSALRSPLRVERLVSADSESTQHPRKREGVRGCLNPRVLRRWGPARHLRRGYCC